MRRRVLRPAILFILVLGSLGRPPTWMAEARPRVAPGAGVALELPASPLLGETLTLTLTFENTGSDPGYGPYIDLFLPLSGADGQSGGGPNDGISFSSADYLGLPVTTSLLDCPAGSTATHPLTGQTITCPAQPPALYSPFVWQLVAIPLPFGSFVPDQPAAPVTVRADLSGYADVGVGLPVQARGGFLYGADPLDNPVTDPPLQGSMTSATVTPALLTLSKSYDGPEDETASGPNFARLYTVSLNKPQGILLSEVHLIDDLFNNMAYHGHLSCSPAGYTAVQTPTLDAPANPPDNRLDVRWPSVAASATTLTCTYAFFIPLRDADGGTVIDPGSGDAVTSCNQASASGSWAPADPRDSSDTFSLSPSGCEHELNDRSIAIQKSVRVVGGGDPAPGEVLEYTLEFQISDFFAFQNVVVSDVVSDGQHFDPTFAPTLMFNGSGGFTYGGTFDPANYDVACHYTGGGPECDTNTAPFEGNTDIVFRVSDQVAGSGRLIGGCVPTGGTGGTDPDCGTYDDGPTTGRVVFHTIIQEDFTDSYPSNDPSVDQGDRLSDSVTIEGELLWPSDAATPTGQSEADASAAPTSLPYGSIAKSIYAVNGNTSVPTPVRVSPGDAVTYRIAYSLPTSDFEDLVISDYLPLPIYSAGEVSTFTNSVCGIPAAGVSCLGPADTYHSLPGAVSPSFSTSSSSNSLHWSYGDYDAPANPSSTIDLLFTVSVRNNPFADGLYLTNQAYAQEGSTNSGSSVSTGIVQVQLQEPLMQIRKGVVWTDNPNGVFTPSTVGPVAFDGAAATCAGRLGGLVNSSGLAATPVDSDLSDVDAGDRVMMAIVVENVGRHSAFDVRVRDWLPTDMSLVPGSVCVTDGTGAAFFTTDLGGGLFASGLELDDPGPTDPPAGALDPGRAGDGSVLDNGRNLAVITYLVTLENAIPAGASRVNTATLFHYANTEGGPDFTGDDPTDTAEVRVRYAGLGKVFTTEIIDSFNTQTQAVIGETITYTLTVTVPEGQMSNVTLEDTLPAGLAFVDCLSVTPSSPDVTTDLPGGFIAACNDPDNPTVTSSGQAFTFTLGTIVNANRDNGQSESIDLQFTAVTLNVATNQAGTTLRNTARLVIDGGAGGIATVQSSALTVIEPTVNTTKSVLPTTADAGDTLAFTVTLTNPVSDSTTAHDVAWADTVPSGLTYVAGSLALGSCTAATPPLLDDTGAPTLAASGGLLQPGQSCQIVFQATVDYSVSPGQVLTNTAQTRWTSLAGAVSDRSVYNDASDERTGEDGLLGSGVLNDYRTEGSASVTITFTPQKSIVSTSEDHTGSVAGYEQLVIGEIVRYRLVVQWPEGMAPEAMLRDALPAGLQFLDEDPPANTRVAFVCNGSPACMTSSTLGSAPVVPGNETTVGGVTPAYVLPDASVSSSPTTDSDAYGSGTDPYFKFGDLVNSDDDADQEFIVLELNALVLNVSGNQGGTSRDNSFVIRIGGVEQSPASNSRRIYIAEPVLALSKALADAPSDAGDPITYALTISAAAGSYRATAFDIRLTDTFDPYVTDLAVAGVSTTQGPTCVGHGSGTTPFSHNGGLLTGSTLTFTATCLDAGNSIVITVGGTVVSDVPAGYTVPNTAHLVYTSLPSSGTSPNPTGSVTPGASGSGTGERNGDDGVGGGLNDYAAATSRSAPLAPPVVDKLAADPVSAPVGAAVTFPILVTLPEGVTQDLVVIDDLPLGLVYVSHTVVATAAGSGGLLTEDFNGTLPMPVVTAPGGSGEDVTFDFGSITTAADNGTNNNAFLILITARVHNESGNQNGTALPNTARLTYTDPDTGTTTISDPNAENVIVLEPELDIAKSVDDAAPTHGQNLTYTLTVRHLATSTAAAYDLAVTDAIPAGLTYVPGSISGPAGWTTNDAAAPTLAWTCSAPCSLALGSTASLAYQVTVNGPPGPPNPGDVLSNTASMVWTSLDGTSSYERTGADGPGGLNDYRNSDLESITLTAVDLAVAKEDGGITVAAGDTIPYTLTYSNNGNNIASGVTIADTVPANTTFNPDASTPGWTCAPDNHAGSTCTFFVGSLGPGDGGSVTFAVTVDNPLPSGVTQIENMASIADDGTHGPDADPGDNRDSDDTPVGAAPDLVIAKDDGATVVSPGQVIAYTLTISNVGTQDAVGVVVRDAIPPHSTFLSASDGGTYDSGTRVVTWPSFDLAAGSSPITRILTIRIDDPFLGSSVTNAAHVEDDGANGPDLNPADNDDEDTDRVLTISADLTKALVATNQGFTPGGTVAVGEVVTYEIAFTVPAGGSLPDLTLVDVLDRGLTFVGCVSIEASDPAIVTTLPGGFSAACSDPLNPTVETEPPGSANPADPGRRVTFSLGNVSNNGTSDGAVAVRYQAVVLDVLENQDGVGDLENRATLAWASGSLSAAASSVVIVEPDMELEKAADRTVALPGSTITFTLTFRHSDLSNVDAFDVLLSDTLPVGLMYVPGSLIIVSGPAGGVADDSGAPALRVRWPEFPLLTGGERTEAAVRFEATLGGLSPGQGVTNTSLLEWSSLPGDVSSPQSAYNVTSTERFYDPGSEVNVYGLSASVMITVPRLPSTGFPPGRVTNVPAGPPGTADADLGNLWLEIPSLGVRAPIVGIPASGEEWDLRWLWSQAGWLEGTAYPTRPGNSALTAHVYLPNGLPGPFVHLGNLRWGDRVTVHAGELEYVYEVRQVMRVRPEDLSVLRHETHSWLTLLTCEGYDSRREGYRWRLAVRAVLMEVRAAR